MVILALGAMTLACEDQNFNEVEETVLDNPIFDPHDDDEEIVKKPGNGN